MVLQHPLRQLAPNTSSSAPPNHPRLDSVLPSPLAGRVLVLGPRSLVHMGDLWDQGIIRVGVGKHRTDRQ